MFDPVVEFYSPNSSEILTNKTISTDTFELVIKIDP